MIRIMKELGSCSQLHVGHGPFTAAFAAWTGGDKEQGTAQGQLLMELQGSGIAVSRLTLLGSEPLADF